MTNPGKLETPDKNKQNEKTQHNMCWTPL